MSKKESKFYICLHESCAFKTDKRKAIYTHLVRTHNERKEDYECEYCSKVFHQDSEIEQHLHVQHPQQPFTYTCVSRIENIINTCAKMGSESRNPESAVHTNKASNEKIAGTNQSLINDQTPKTAHRANFNLRTKASVNASLNNIAKNVSAENMFKPIDDEYLTDDDDEDEDMDEVELETDDDGFELDSEEETPTYVSEPSGLKIKLSLKKERDNSSANSQMDVSSSPPLLESNNTSRNESGFIDSTPPDIVHSSSRPVTVSTAQVRDKASKYYDKLEVYHSTDDFGRRCCPFCDYKTSKNTIRVHLSGIHKIHFVKCSLCDYKAAFPHQITQHGIKFHKTTNLNVIQLTKESREKIIEHLKRSQNGGTGSSATSDAKGMNATIVDEDFNSEESYPSSADEAGLNPETLQTGQADDRVFKAPICQTSKTDYYRIQFENGVYMYSCNLCTFQTPVRATIYTHKYRHEEKSYMCGYCDFTSAPRSNIVHHCRSKHKGRPVKVREADDVLDIKQELLENADVNVKTEDIQEENVVLRNKSRKTPTSSAVQKTQEKAPQTIIKVPQFKRSISSVFYKQEQIAQDKKKAKMAAENDVGGPAEYKLSLNKLYRINPSGSPKFLCVMCSYACDTHPKMKHHLYRHRPQKYKCPYCDHRKYPRSYVVRHVRDTHRNKPVRVIDLSKGNEPEDIQEYARDGADLDDTGDCIDQDKNDMAEKPTTVKEEPTDNSYLADDNSNDTNEEVNELKKFAQNLNLRSVLTADLNDDILSPVVDASSNFDETSFTSTPLIESMINGQYQTSTPKESACASTCATKNFEKKKSLKDYRVNYGNGPRYLCNKCGYGTENYKTIHNHMYRHESQRYQCPYCGYRRSPKSFVENHIREVHKGHPVIVTELTIDHDIDAPIGSPRQCVGLKRKDSPSDHTDESVSSNLTPAKQQKTSPQFPAKWPAPKPVNHETPAVNQNLTISIKKEHSEPVPTTDYLDDSAGENEDDQSPCISTQKTGLGLRRRSPAAKLSPPIMVNPVKFKEGSRTTFKTMYKCTFDPETCNHISKDKSKMKQHLFMHVEYKPWSCDFCEMTASQSSHIKNHVRTEHPGTPDTSFRYKKHNYLEKHIEGFLSKGLFTVPVNEYRAIMDMKGNTKSSKQPIFSRDLEGNIECPYCSYKTKSGGMTDHVKMKHMQPRFKCHWCDYRAFYRSEVRKHHRKEKSHAGFDFKTQELDLVQVVEEFREKNEGNVGLASNDNSSIHYILPMDDDDDDDDDDEEDDVDQRSEYSTSDSSSFGDFQHGYAEYTTQQLSELCSNKQTKADPYTPDDNLDQEDFVTSINTEISDNGSIKIVSKPSTRNLSQCQSPRSSKFKCGYCSFSAALRVKVKMHCSKKHPKRPLNVIHVDPPSEVRAQGSYTANTFGNSDNIVNISSDEIKGTKFEQDLRKAGVAKLNLASLFPNSKRFHKDGDNETELDSFDGKINVEEVSVNKSTSEFKIPLEPVIAQKAVNRNTVELKEIEDKHMVEKVEVSVGNAETNEDQTDDTVAEITEPADIEIASGKLQTTYPHCTPVILETDGDNSNSCDETESENNNDIDQEGQKSKPKNCELEHELDDTVVKENTILESMDTDNIHSVENATRIDRESGGNMSFEDNVKLDGTEADAQESIKTNGVQNEYHNGRFEEQSKDNEHSQNIKLSDNDEMNTVDATRENGENAGKESIIDNGLTNDLVKSKHIMEICVDGSDTCVMDEMYQEH